MKFKQVRVCVHRSSLIQKEWRDKNSSKRVKSRGHEVKLSKILALKYRY